MSSSAVFGMPSELPLKNHPKKPVEIYGKSKKMLKIVMSLIASNPSFL